MSETPDPSISSSTSREHSSEPLWGSRRAGGRSWIWSVWAPQARTVDLSLDHPASQSLPMQKRGETFHLTLDNFAPERRYAFSINGGPPRPDPASRWQPDGVHAPSALFDPDEFLWTDSAWMGLQRRELVIYELHTGTFTSEGTFAAIIPRLPALLELGITAIELMPVHQFPGNRNWGYDGVFPFAVQNTYGGPRELQKLVDACHGHGIGVILDVVYNHFGPEGNFLPEFAPCFSLRHRTPWGAGINFDDTGSSGIRSFILENVAYWLRNFHLDGLRLDAVHAICDTSPTHILSEIKQVADSEARRRDWPAHIIAESNLNDARILEPHDRGGYQADAQWNDDFHHAVHALLTGEQEGYYADFHHPAPQLAKACNEFFVLDGCFSRFRGRPHGNSVSHLSGDRFIVSIQTHDQIGNRPRGDRLHTLVTPEKQRLAACLLLLSPNIPQLFMGEEYGETRPFPFFCDFSDPELQAAVRNGRKLEFADSHWQHEPFDPLDEATFEQAKLSWSWSANTPQAGLRQLYSELLAARRRFDPLQDFIHRRAELQPGSSGENVLVLHRGMPADPDFQVISVFNLSSLPVLAPAPSHLTHRVLLRSEDLRFGGNHRESFDDGSLLPYECIVYVPAVSPPETPLFDKPEQGA